MLICVILISYSQFTEQSWDSDLSGKNWIVCIKYQMKKVNMEMKYSISPESAAVELAKLPLIPLSSIFFLFVIPLTEVLLPPYLLSFLSCFLLILFASLLFYLSTVNEDESAQRQPPPPPTLSTINKSKAQKP